MDYLANLSEAGFPRFVVTCDFNWFRVLDLEVDQADAEPVQFALADFLAIADWVMLIGDGDRIVKMNPATYAVEWLGSQMAGKANQAGFATEEDVADYIPQMRRDTAPR